ncbi:MAG: cation:proton antiporter, partial [Kiritimatiellia bacterium]
MLMLMLQLSVILIGSRLGGLLVSRYLRQPRVFGELLAGMLIGPYALGAFSLPLLNTPLFPVNPDAPLPISPELYGLATLASIILLFMVGLETDLNRFMRYSVTGTLVGLGGVLLSFCLGCLVTVLFMPEVSSLMDPVALFMGTLSTATSVGITARILSERHKTSSPEGVTILAGAVFDDVLCIILLAVVV